jgi:hypothetical protein
VEWKSLSTGIVSQSGLFVTDEKVADLAGRCLDRLFPHRRSIERVLKIGGDIACDTCLMMRPVLKEQVVTDARYYCRYVAADAVDVTNWQAEADQTSRIKYVNVFQIRGSARYFFLVFVGATEVRVHPQIVVAQVFWWLVAIAPEGNRLLQVG